MDEVCAVVMAAGDSHEMHSSTSRLVHDIGGKPIIRWVSDALCEAGAGDQLYVVGKDQNEIRMTLGEHRAYVLQDPPLGTGNACLQAAPFLESRSGCALIVSGDVPLITANTLKEMVERFRQEECAVLVLTAQAPKAETYGRVFCDADRRISHIVEADDATPEELNQTLINAGVYCFDCALLLSAIGITISNNNNQLCNLVDVIGTLIEQGHSVLAHETDFEEVIGVNNRVQLQQAAAILNRRICESHMNRGVTIFNPETVRIDHSVELGKDVIIQPNCILTGSTSVGDNTMLGPDMDIHSSQIGKDGVFIRSWIRDSVVGDDCRIGPNCQLTNQSILKQRVHMASGAVAQHIILGNGCRIGVNAYLCNIQIGEGTHVGAGTVTNGELGERMWLQTVGNNVTVGANVTLSGELEIGSNSTIGDGALITQNIPDFSVARVREKLSISPIRGRRQKENKKSEQTTIIC